MQIGLDSERYLWGEMLISGLIRMNANSDNDEIKNRIFSIL